MESTRIFAASAILAAMIGSIYEYLALMEITSVSPARVVLCCVGFFGVMFVWELLITFSYHSSGKKKILVLVISVLLLAAILFFGDRKAIAWKASHPSEVGEIHADTSDMKLTLHEVVQNQVSQMSKGQPLLKEIMPVPGYLKIRLAYRDMPPDQLGKPVSIDIGYYNVGSTYTHHSATVGILIYVDFNGAKPKTHDPDVKQKVVDAIAKLEIRGTEDVAPGDGLFNSYSTQPLTKDMLEKINLGTARIYYAGHAEWESVAGKDQVTSCIWLQPSAWAKSAIPSIDITKAQPAWHEC